MKKYLAVFLFAYLPVSVTYAASPVILENPPVLYFSGANPLTMQQVEKIVVDAVISTNMPEHVWSVTNKQAGQVSVSLVVRNKHYAYIDVQYTTRKILISYQNSQNLKYEKFRGKYEIIHPNYMKWVSYLVTSLKNQTQLLASGDRLSSTLEVSDVPVAGHQRMVLLAHGESSSLDDGNSISNTDEKLSNVLMNMLVRNVSRSKPDNVDLIPVNDPKMTGDFFAESHALPISQAICSQYRADKIVGFNSPLNLGGRGQRYVYFYLYVCDKGRKFREKYSVESGEYDRFSFQGDTQAAMGDFIDYAKIYR